MASYTLHIQYVDRPAETRSFTQAKITFGRDVGDVVLHDSQVSGRHGEITFDGSTLRYTDVGSTNGSFLMQGQRVANIELTPGIALRLGNSLVTVQAIDAPNVAGKGRTVIAGPGMAPGFPAPMRPGVGPGPVAAAGAPIPRPPAPQPVAPGAPPPGGFAFAPTAQMQSPMAPPQPVAPLQPVRPAFSPVAPQPGPVQPAFSPVAPQPVFSPMPQAVPPGPPPGGVAPQPVAPEPDDAATPMPDAPEPEVDEVPEVAFAPVGTPQLDTEQPKDLVSGIKLGLKNSWAVVSPVFVGAVALPLVVFAGLNVVSWLFAMILPAAIAGIFALLLSLAMLGAVVVLVPSIVRIVLGSYLGLPIGPKEAVQETVAKIGDRGVNLVIPTAILGVFAGPIYFVEGRKLGDVISRNFNLWGKDWVTVLLCIIAVNVVTNVSLIVVTKILLLVPVVGALLAAVISGAVLAVNLVLMMGVSVYFYFSYRRRFEGGDPEAEGRVALGGVGSLPQP